MFSTVPTASGRDRILISTCIVLVTALAWAYLIHLDRQMSAASEYDRQMAAMGMSTDTPWTVADGLFNFFMWLVMMIGMMAPSVAPMLMLVTAAHPKQAGKRAGVSIPLFGGGYFGVWAAFSLVAAAIQWLLHNAAMLSPAMKTSSPRIAGGILLLAGLYQITPWKSKCLSHCRSPLGFLMTHWHDGFSGAVRMGAEHGLYCLGCCWAMMLLMFATGAMNIVWMAALGALMTIEKMTSTPRFARVLGIGFIDAGFGFLVLGFW